MSLDPYPGDAEILRRLEEKKRGAPVECSESPRAAKLPKPRIPLALPDASFEASKDPDGYFNSFHGIVHGPARTKKNHTTLGIRQSPSYKRWEKTVVNAFGRDHLPAMNANDPWGFPRYPLTLKALFYVDAKGVKADLIGLLQGFCDALQEAEVVPDDIYIESFDGSRKLSYDTSHPRVEFWLAPL